MIPKTSKTSKTSSPGRTGAVLVGLLIAASTLAPRDARSDEGEAQAEAQASFDLSAVQGILSIQQLDGWLLYDYRGLNPIALELIEPRGAPSRRWFYLIPARGQPLALIHRVDAASFEHVPGRKAVYATYGDLERGLTSMLRGKRRIAMEYSPRARLPSLSRVDAGTIELVRSKRVKVRSSADLVQLTKALWGPDGRLSHYVAAHHLEELRKAALDYVARRIKRGKPVTERDVQKYLLRGYQVRGLLGPAPVVAAGANTADPQYVPSRERNAAINKGDLVLIDMWVKVESDKRPIVANTTWMAYVGETVPKRHAEAFTVAAAARNAALALIRDRITRRRAIKGFEVDRQARNVIAEAGHGDKFPHRTGHSIDTNVHGSGTNLDDYETRDTRSLVSGAGFSISPGIYFPGEFGVRTEINVYLGPEGVEVTTPAQDAITAILTGK